MKFKYKRFIACFIAMFFMILGIYFNSSISLAAGTTKIIVQINVKQNSVDIDVTNKKYYITLFKDAELTDPIGNPKSVTIINASSGKIEFTDLQSGTYYVAQTDSEGAYLEEEGVDVSCSKTDNKVTVKDEDGTDTVVMTYDYEYNPNEASTATTTATAQATTKSIVNTTTTTRATFNTVTTTVSATNVVTDSAKTADNSHITFYSIVALFCIVAAGWIVYDRKKSIK